MSTLGTARNIRTCHEGDAERAVPSRGITCTLSYTFQLRS